MLGVGIEHAGLGVVEVLVDELHMAVSTRSASDIHSGKLTSLAGFATSEKAGMGRVTMALLALMAGLEMSKSAMAMAADIDVRDVCGKEDEDRR